MRVLGRSPAIYIMLVIGFIIAYVTYNKTSIGLNARAVGGNADVAQMMGINTRRALMLGGLMAGFFFGFAGVMKESYAGYVVAQTGLSSLSTVFQPPSCWPRRFKSISTLPSVFRSVHFLSL